MPRALAATLAALGCLARGAGAQLTPQVDATVVTRPAVAIGGTRPPNGATPLLSAGLRFDAPRLSLSVAGDAPTGESAAAGARASLVAATPSWRGLHASVSAAARRDALGGIRATWRGAGGAQLALERPRGGVWIGYDVGRFAAAVLDSGSPRPGGLGSDSLGGVNVTRTPVARLDWHTVGRGSLGGWVSLGSLVASAAVRGGTEHVPSRPSTLQPRTVWDTIPIGNGRDSVVQIQRVFGDSGSAGGLRRLTDGDVRLAWTHGRTSIAAAAGMRLLDWASGDPRVTASPGQRGWATLDAIVGVGQYLAVVGGVGSRPAGDGAGAMLAALSQPAGLRTRYATLGLRVSPRVFSRPALPVAVRPSAAAFSLRAVGAGRYALRVRVPAARAVELSGELTTWRAVAMKRVDADAWEAVLPAHAGSYRVSIRVDGGAWVAPPGLQPVDDDFGGSAAVVVVP